MPIVIMGKTASGKTKLVEKLVTEHGFKKLVTYTTRKMRPGEIDSVDYHFISEEDFMTKLGENFFAEHFAYNTEEGVWHYGSAKEDWILSDDKTVVILTPDGYRKIIDSLGFRPKLIYLYVNNETIKQRLKKRKDNSDEAERRLVADNKDFKGADLLADKIIYNNEGTNLDDVVKKIIEYVEGNK